MRIFRVVISLITSLVLLIYPRPVQPVGEITVALLGDIMLGRYIATAHLNGSWGQVLGVLQPEIAKADLAIANLESPLTNQPLQKTTYDLRAPGDSAEALSKAGISYVSLANNHSLDAGLAGLEDTRVALLAHGINWVGPEPEPTYLKIKDREIVLLAFNTVTQPPDLNSWAALITKAKKNADWVIVSIHWGGEYEGGPSPSEIEIANRLIQAGADIIAGHHPHVLQVVRNVKNGEKTSLVAYSLGNALFDQPTPPATKRGAVLLVTLGSSGVKGSSAIPFIIDPLKGQVEASTAEEWPLILHSLDLSTTDDCGCN